MIGWIIAGLSGTALAATSPVDCTAGLDLRQASHPARSSQERLDEYLAFHAHATRANGPTPMQAQPAVAPGTN